MRSFILLLITITLSAAAFSQKKDSKQLYRNRIGITPLCGIVAYGYVNPGVGFDNEYLLDPSKGIGVHYSFSYGFDDGAYSNLKHNSFVVTSGVHFHSNPNGHVDFAMGPSLLFGKMYFQPKTDNSSAQSFEPYNYSMFALLVDNSLNFNYKRFQWGIDFRMGPMLERQNSQQIFWNFGMHFGRWVQ
jgi:hypothetical protein